MEEWKEIDGYEAYQVSSRGEIKRSTILRQQLNHKGYSMVKLSLDGSMKGFSVHRLVALAFIPNPMNLPQIDHIDRDKTNNCVINLRWVTQSENMLNRESKRGVLNEKYISMTIYDTYNVKIRREGVSTISNSFTSLKEAIHRRDEVLTSLLAQEGLSSH